MRERPILFGGQMVRAILDGSKTQTRRVVKPLPHAEASLAPHISGTSVYGREARFRMPDGREREEDDGMGWRRCPYGEPGDRLWVRETWAASPLHDERKPSEIGHRCKDLLWYQANEQSDLRGRWRPSIHMPRWASRITLEVTDVRVELVQEISEEDARAEGIRQLVGGHVWKQEPVPGDPRDWWLDATGAFHDLWDSINGKRPDCSWADNPWVWAISFSRCEP